MADLLPILRRNFLSPIVIAIAVLAVILLVLGARQDALFISAVIFVNTLIGTVQEIRAQRALKKLELLTAPKARRISTDGSAEEIPYDHVAVNDTLSLLTGDEIAADGEVLTGAGLEADESILTGESAPVEKPAGAAVLAGTAVVAGTATMRVTAIGADTRAGTMSATLRRYSPTPTPLQRAISRAITWLSFGALGLSAAIFIVYFFAGRDAVTIFKTITSGAVTVVPEGLLLASTLLLAFGSLKLAQAKVLPQKLGAVEAMALLDVLAVDKTGTLTSDLVTFEAVETLAPDTGEADERLRSLIAITARETGSGSSTGEAIIKGLSLAGEYQIRDVLAFSSTRKLGGVRVSYGGRTETMLLGAPEFVSRLAPLSSEQSACVQELAGEGKRVLLAATFDDSDVALKELAPGSGRPAALVVLSNRLRDGVTDTVAYFQENGVSLRVISGDNPATVSYIAAQAGITGADHVITGAELAKLNDDQWTAAALDTTIFARVLPEQKERLIATFRQHGRFTGMVGDGVNDALALKKADLGVAMFAGAIATRRVADIVLLNNSFNSLPLGMKLGNRIIQAIELIATLFFHKLIYTILLLVATLALGMVYPFEPRHITFMNIFLVTMPTIIWTLFLPLARKGISPRFFWHNTLLAVAPIAAVSAAVVTTCYVVLSRLHPANHAGVSTTIVIIATLFGVYLVFLVPRILNVEINRAAQLARVVYILAVLLVTALSFGFDVSQDFFSFERPVLSPASPLWLLIIGGAVVQLLLARAAGKRLTRREHRAV